jgi:exonuclease SbcC
MKILNLKFKNINSLAGEWAIDFTEPQFIDNGLFAITGRTGAGKSSILDAVSLALYGKTPRVEITGKSNDVMTRGEIDCYAEIVFETDIKIWKSAWKQEKKRNGDLKPVQRQISDNEDKIIADQIKKCDIKIVEILGLTFEQFTKVVMLAQGSFAAFLQADKNDKGELLEQITGTEIYSEISKRVFERNKAEKLKLETILSQLEVIKILDETEVLNLKNSISEFEKQKMLFDNELKTIETAKKWLLDLQNLKNQIAKSKEKLPELLQKLEAVKTVFDTKETILKSAKEELKNNEPILQKVRELDTKIAEKENILKPILQTIADLEKSKKNLCETIEKQKNNLLKSQENLLKLQNWAEKNKKYETLTARFSAVENQNIQVISLKNDFTEKNTDLEKAKKDLQTKICDFNNSQRLFSEKEKTLKAKTLELTDKNAELSKILAGRELFYYQSEKEKITTFGRNLKDLIDAEKAVTENKKEIDKYTEIIAQSGSREKELFKSVTEAKTGLEILDNQILLLDENIRMTKIIQSLDEHRYALEDGKPCPLCGATEHPFARGNEPKIGKKEQDFQKLKQDFQKLNSEIQQNEKELAKSVSNKENALINSDKENRKLEENRKKAVEILNEIKKLNPDFVCPEEEKRINFFEKMRTEKLNQYSQTDTIIKKATESENQIKKLQNDEIPKLQQDKQTAETAKNEAETAMKLAEQKVENCKNLTETIKMQYETANDELLRIFTEYKVENLENLKRCLDDWNENRKKTELSIATITALSGEIALKNSELTNTEKHIDEKQSEKKNFDSDRQILENQRIELFGEKKADDEEIRLKNAVAKAETEKNAAEQEKTVANTEIEKTNAVIVEKEKELTAKQAENLTELSSEKLQAAYDEKKAKSDEFSQKIGANIQTLISNEQNFENNRKKLSEQKFQQKICSKWGSLDVLIGSADGKKYRNFAQALTFEHLIGLANRQLQKMSERYLLKRVGDAANPFELAVIDKFQNCDERTAQNLSGGEKFIVSLSMALGLANMASRNMRIDTMFIDEGFGTLDSDYLDVALSALSNLQNEGKLIGVISHLTELKERIATHIEVVPKGNGHSQIKIQ